MLLKCLRLGCAALVVFTAFGCEKTGKSASKSDLAERAKYLLTDEPDGAQSILSVREELADGENYVLFGRVGGVPDPWSPGKAAFVIADPVALLELDSDGHQCSDGCAFCKKEKGHPARHLAMVRIVDKAGALVPVDARKLLDLETGDMVVVRGTVVQDKLGNLIVNADGVHVRR